MSEITRVGADLAKSVIQVHAVDVSGKVITNRPLARDYWVFRRIVTGHQPSHFQRVVTGARLAQREIPVVQGTGLHGKEERKSFVERANLLNRPRRSRTVGGVGGDG